MFLPLLQHVLSRCLIICLAVFSLGGSVVLADQPPGTMLEWNELPPLPDELGVAGPFAGVHHDVLIVAGGANFPKPVWAGDKAWHDSVHVLVRRGGQYAWEDGGKLPRPLAYGAAVSTADGIVCMGGNDADETFDDVFLMQYDAATDKVTTAEFPSLPAPCAFGSAALVGDVIYLAGGQSGLSLDTAMKNFWSLDLSKRDDAIIVPSGEIRPRVRSPKVWRVKAIGRSLDFGVINYGVLFGYLFAMVGIGVYFANKNKTTDDYFRGGKNVA